MFLDSTVQYIGPTKCFFQKELGLSYIRALLFLYRAPQYKKGPRLRELAPAARGRITHQRTKGHVVSQNSVHDLNVFSFR